jgi:GWxTD domain-containing protein
MPVSRSGASRVWNVALVGLLLVGCSPRTRGGSRENRRAPSPAAAAPDPSAFYRQLGMIAQGGAFPFVGQLRYLAGPTPDSTLVLVSLSFANHTLTFTGDPGGQRASYGVTLDVSQGSSTVRHLDVRKVIRVASFHETQRDDESVIFQQFLMLPPGSYSLSVSVHDEGSGNANVQQMQITVPRFTARTLSTPISIYQVKPRIRTDTTPVLIANPRSTIVMGRDTLAGVYLEGYGLAPAERVAVAVLNDAHAAILRDTVQLTRQGALSSALLDFPVSRVGVGPVTVVARLVGSNDSVSAPLFIGFGDEFGITSFDELLSYLRYFVSPERLQLLRDMPPEQRASAWATFWRQTDPNPATPEHEALRDYFQRIATANMRYREEGTAGWLTDRGKVFITLGEPDQTSGEGSARSTSSRGRSEIWQYAQYRAQFIFVNQNGFSRFRLTPASEADFERLVKRLQSTGTK